MNQTQLMTVQPSETDLMEWGARDLWTAKEAVQIALGKSPMRKPVKRAQKLVEEARQSGWEYATPLNWLWWGENNRIPFHPAWWTMISPKGPIGYDGCHFAWLRGELLSPAFVKRERELIMEWARKPYWTKREAIDLLRNFAPFTADGWRGEAPETGPMIREQEDRFRILDRAIEIGEIEEKSPPAVYLQWFSDKGYYVSAVWRRAFDMKLAQPLEVDLSQRLLRQEIESLREEVARGKAEISDLTAKQKQGQAPVDEPVKRSAETRQSTTYLKIIASMAIDAYRFSPHQKKSDVPKQIADMSDELGCSVTTQTIRSKLDEACEHYVSGDYWTSQSP